ncbi:MAG TPA: hypothetical protein VLA61_00270 [Ideonella sp.]|uniref:hypothetical protein n=1 Tax=Ideonella sp. TaxID=1929293 RepID=UPI002C184B68|nr:hypothetical protein [Ideonella sp.]HSI46684.1 hypothetical protein [Ideonella sp.]
MSFSTIAIARSTRLLGQATLLSLCTLAAAHAAAFTAGEKDAADYCVKAGGTSSVVYPYGNTNADAAQWVRYAGSKDMCTFEAADGSQIAIWNKTLNTKMPSMAALAYYAKVPMGSSSGNPAFAYCVNKLGGAELIGAAGSGSGWATAPGERVYAMCNFADGSAIDDWGLTYHSADIVRGIDLSTVLHFANPY